jgi:hypothetical protein
VEVTIGRCNRNLEEGQCPLAKLLQKGDSWIIFRKEEWG